MHYIYYKHKDTMLDPSLYALSWNFKNSHVFSGSFLYIIACDAPIDPPLYALGWNLKNSCVFSGSFLCIKMNGKKLNIPEMCGSAGPGGDRTPVGPL